MKAISVSDVYNVTQISKTNNEAWEKLIQIMSDEAGEVEFDFRGINLEEPWNNEAFKKLLGDERVYLKIYSSQTLCDTIELACKIGNMKTGRVTNIDEVASYVEPKKNTAFDLLVERFKDGIVIKKNRGVLALSEILAQVGENKTVEALGKAIEEFSGMTGVTDFDIYTEYMVIQLNVLESIAKLKVKLQDKKINMEIFSRYEDITGKISIYQCIGSSKYWTPHEKLEKFKDLVKDNTVGMLSTYVYTKKLDETGRRGKGEVLSCRVAIFKGVDDDNNLEFLTFNVNYFHTKLHYAMEKDGEELTDLVTDTVKVKIDEIGLTDKFLGTDYHFLMPIQYSLDDYINTYKEDYDGRIMQQELTLPEYIKVVLEDFRKDKNGRINKYAEYNEAALINDIGKTMRILDMKRNNQT